ncbi:MAG: SRPBCC domain-containing protein [Actinomycetota bacterium]
MAREAERMEAGPAIEREVRIEASPDIVFELLTDPEQYVRWKGRAARLDARAGGEFRVEINDQATAVGEYLEVDPPNRVVFTWGWQGNDAVPPGSSTVEITLEPDGDATILRLVHSGLPAPAVGEHTQGWDHYLGRLVKVGAGRDPGPDPHQSLDV